MKIRVSGKTGSRILACLASLVFAGVLAAPAQSTSQPAVAAPAWKSYSYATEGFSVTAPSEPEMSKRDVPTDAGSFQLRSYVATDGDVAMMVGVCDYGSTVAGKDPNTVLQGAKSGALTNSRSHLTSEKQITLGIYPGLQFDSESDSTHFSVRIYFVGTTLYQVLVVAPLSEGYPGSLRFLDSFQFIPRTAD